MTLTLNQPVTTLHRGPTHDLCDDVFLLEHDGCARLLDLRRCRFYALDKIGTDLLRGCMAAGEWHAIYGVARRFDVLSAEVSRDWRALEERLEAKGLISRRDIPVALSLPGRLFLFIQLALAWVSVRVLTWETVVRLWRGKWKRPRYNWPEGRLPRLLADFDRQLRRAASGHLLNPECKELALVAWRTLRCRYGLPAELVLGVIPYPFQAHAWVEVDGTMVSDDAENCQGYQSIRRYR